MANFVFCLTGTLSMVREQWHDIIEQHGGGVSKDVTRSVRGDSRVVPKLLRASARQCCDLCCVIACVGLRCLFVARR